MRRQFSWCRKFLPVGVPAILLLTIALLHAEQPQTKEPTPQKRTETKGSAKKPATLEMVPPPPPTEKPGEPAQIRKMTREDLEIPLRLAKKVYESLETRCRKGEMIDLESAHTWSRRILDYERELDSENGDRLIPYRANMLRMRMIVHQYSMRVIEGRVQEDSDEVARAQFFYRDASNSLLRAAHEGLPSPAHK